MRGAIVRNAPGLLNNCKGCEGKVKFLRFLLIVFAVGYSAASNAVTVKGMKSCGAWLKNRTEQPAPSLGTRVDSAWLAGYLSGVAVARNIDFLKGVDESIIKSWMDNYCSSHPLDLMGNAADALSIELKNRMR
jgi:hypothetical protein